jgi:hypothetical protein
MAIVQVLSFLLIDKLTEPPTIFNDDNHHLTLAIIPRPLEDCSSILVVVSVTPKIGIPPAKSHQLMQSCGPS